MSQNKTLIDTCYKILVGSKSDTKTEVKHQYRIGLLNHHPDKSKEKKSEEITKCLIKMYKSINNHLEHHTNVATFDPHNAIAHDTQVANNSPPPEGHNDHLGRQFADFFNNERTRFNTQKTDDEIRYDNRKSSGYKTTEDFSASGLDRFKAASPHVPVNITLEDIYNQSTVTINYMRQIGSNKCYGNETVLMTKSIKLKPTSVRNNKLLFLREGDQTDDFAYKDLAITLNVACHKTYTVSGYDLLVDHCIPNHIKCIMIRLLHLDGLEMEIVTQNTGAIDGRITKILKNKGMPKNSQRTLFGNLIINIILL